MEWEPWTQKGSGECKFGGRRRLHRKESNNNNNKARHSRLQKLSMMEHENASPKVRAQSQLYLLLSCGFLEPRFHHLLMRLTMRPSLACLPPRLLWRHY